LSMLLLVDFEKQYFPVPSHVKSSLSSSWIRLYLLLWLDWILCILVFGPLGLAWWRGAWGVSDLVLYQMISKDDILKLSLIYLSVGLLGVSFCEICHHGIRAFAGNVGTIRHTLTARVFSVVWGFLDLLLWKGVWDGTDYVVGDRWHLAIVTVGLTIAILTLTRTCRTAISFPIGTSVDHPSLHISANTLLKSRGIDSLIHRFIDSVLSRGIEVTAVVLWKSIWILEDEFLTPKYVDLPNLETTDISLVIGLFINLLVFLLQFPLLRLCSNHPPGFITLAANWIFCQLATVSTVSSWRAGWHLVDVYYLPDNRVASLVTCLVFGIGGLLLMNCASLLHPGIGKDNLHQEGVMLGFYYTSYFYILERTRGNLEESLFGYTSEEREEGEREALVGSTSEEDD